MYKILLSVFISMLMFAKAFTQQAPALPPQGHSLSLFATLGTRPFRISTTDIDFAYVDESPSMDNMVADVNLKRSRYSTSLKLGGQYEFADHFFLKGLIDLHLGQITGASVDFGGGYSLGKEKLRIRPQMMFSYGTNAVVLGDLYQNALYIEVNRTQFYSDFVSVTLRSKHFVLSPQIELAYQASEKIELLAGIGYNVALSKGSPFLLFSGEDRNNERVTATESAFAPNVFLYANGEQLRSHLVGLDFVFFQFGIGYRLPQ